MIAKEVVRGLLTSLHIAIFVAYTPTSASFGRNVVPYVLVQADAALSQVDASPAIQQKRQRQSVIDSSDSAPTCTVLRPTHEWGIVAEHGSVRLDPANK